MATALALPGWADVQDPATLPPHAVSEAYIPFAHETLADAEHQGMQMVQQHLSAWLLWTWPWIVGALATWTPRQNREWDRMVEAAHLSPTEWTAAIRQAWEAGADATHGRRSRRAPRQQERAAWLAEVTAAAKMREWADGLKDDVRWQVVRAVRDGWTPRQLAEELAHRWTLAGARWQRIAATELSAAYHTGLLTHVTPGALGYVAPIGDAKVCSACRRLLERRVFRLYPTTPAHPTRADWQGALWPAKSNVGRRTKDWVPCVPLHPNCRHLVTLLEPSKRKKA